MRELATYSKERIPFTVPRGRGYRYGSDIENMDARIVPSDSESSNRHQSTRKNYSKNYRTRMRSNSWESYPAVPWHAEPQYLPHQMSRQKRSTSLINEPYPRYDNYKTVGQLEYHSSWPLAEGTNPLYHQNFSSGYKPSTHSRLKPEEWELLVPVNYPRRNQHLSAPYSHQIPFHLYEPTPGLLRIKRKIRRLINLPFEGIIDPETRLVVASLEAVVILAIIHFVLRLIDVSSNPILPMALCVGGCGYLLMNVLDCI